MPGLWLAGIKGNRDDGEISGPGHLFGITPLWLLCSETTLKSPTTGLGEEVLLLLPPEGLEGLLSPWGRRSEAAVALPSGNFSEVLHSPVTEKIVAQLSGEMSGSQHPLGRALSCPQLGHARQTPASRMSLLSNQVGAWVGRFNENGTPAPASPVR